MFVYVAPRVVRCVPALKLGKNPRSAECASRNHKTVRARNIAHFFKTLQIDYVAVRDDGNIECLFNRFRDNVVGNTAVKLFSVSRVHAHCARSALCAANAHSTALGFPLSTPARILRLRDVLRPRAPLAPLRKSNRDFHKRASVAVVENLFDGTAHVYIHDFKICKSFVLCGFVHKFGIAAEKLNGARR